MKIKDSSLANQFIPLIRFLIPLSPNCVPSVYSFVQYRNLCEILLFLYIYIYVGRQVNCFHIIRSVKEQKKKEKMTEMNKQIFFLGSVYSNLWDFLVIRSSGNCSEIKFFLFCRSFTYLLLDQLRFFYFWQQLTFQVWKLSWIFV